MNIIVVDWCCMCQKSGKSIDHLLITSFVVRWQENYGVRFFIYLVLLGLCWERWENCWWVGEDKLKTLNALEVWRLATLCLMWCIWRELEDQEIVLLELKKMIQSLDWDLQQLAAQIATNFGSILLHSSYETHLVK
jgi:hypothetical protein